MIKISRHRNHKNKNSFKGHAPVSKYPIQDHTQVAQVNKYFTKRRLRCNHQIQFEILNSTDSTKENIQIQVRLHHRESRVYIHK
jgi:hypothetical protein